METCEVWEDGVPKASPFLRPFDSVFAYKLWQSSRSPCSGGKIVTKDVIVLRSRSRFLVVVMHAKRMKKSEIHCQDSTKGRFE